MQIPTPYLIFLGNAPDDLAAKTGQGIVDWRPEHCLGQLRLAHCRADLGIPDCTLAEAATAGARTLVIGTVSPGGDLPGEWLPVLKEALPEKYDARLLTGTKDCECSRSLWASSAASKKRLRRRR